MPAALISGRRRWQVSGDGAQSAAGEASKKGMKAALLPKACCLESNLSTTGKQKLTPPAFVAFGGCFAQCPWLACCMRVICMPASNDAGSVPEMWHASGTMARTHTGCSIACSGTRYATGRVPGRVWQQH